MTPFDNAFGELVTIGYSYLIAMALSMARAMGMVVIFPVFVRTGITGILRTGIVIAIAMPLVPYAMAEIAAAGLEREIWQAFAVLPDIKTVGVMGDERTYAHPIIIRAGTSDDAMTADWARLPYELLETMSNRIINEVDGVNRVAYDVTSKPPGTIEWEEACW